MVEAIQADAIAATKAEYQVLTCSQFQWDAMTKRLEHLEQESKSKDAEIAGLKAHKDETSMLKRQELLRELEESRNQTQLLLAQVAVMSEFINQRVAHPKQCFTFTEDCCCGLDKILTSLPAEAQQLLEDKAGLAKAIQIVETELDSIGRASYMGSNFERHFCELFYRCEALRLAIDSAMKGTK